MITPGLVSIPQSVGKVKNGRRQNRQGKRSVQIRVNVSMGGTGDNQDLSRTGQTKRALPEKRAVNKGSSSPRRQRTRSNRQVDGKMKGTVRREQEKAVTWFVRDCHEGANGSRPAEVKRREKGARKKGLFIGRKKRKGVGGGDFGEKGAHPSRKAAPNQL